MTVGVKEAREDMKNVALSGCLDGRVGGLASDKEVVVCVFVCRVVISPLNLYLDLYGVVYEGFLVALLF